MFSTLREHFTRPPLFSVYSVHRLWADDHISSRMLEHHLDPDSDIASRNHAFIRRAASWLVDEFDLVGRRVLDLGCGPGLYAMELARREVEVTGVDFSNRSIAPWINAGSFRNAGPWLGSSQVTSLSRMR